MSEINQKDIKTKTIITLCVVKGYTCCFESEAFASFVSIALWPWITLEHEYDMSRVKQAILWGNGDKLQR